MRTVTPDFGAVAAAGDLSAVIGALLTIALTVAVATLIVCSVTWAIAAGTGAWQVTARARTGVLVALGGAALSGGGLAWLNWLLNTGAHL
ncbi:hypothetical protein ET495_10090 [Xylanimonas allomyrinae]|uniref:Uncharacterized protein n=1 Tax=Xylanimonas allomyrinae TaxID=2509459 RepID=A0A4P6EQ59_9MICO|nr:DUF6112 family protein [Xylanimonas allomyrinae]QAY63539.1 hypothetical protein ET495_10090 [Xylanimonas allomyrinae]